MQPYLEFTGSADGMGGATATTKVMPDDIGSDDIEWDDVAFPFANAAATPATTWANGDWEGQTSGEFWIKGVYLDASGGDDEVTASIRMTVPSASLGTDAEFDSDRDEVDVADIDAGMELSFTDKHDNGKPGKPNACNPAKFTIAVDVEEGYRSAWMAQNDILLSLSSGSMKDLAKTGVTGALEDTEEGAAGELIYEVTNTRGDNTAALMIEITPAVGEEGDDITLSAEFLPERRSGEEFSVSDELVVGTYAACKGEACSSRSSPACRGGTPASLVVNNSNVDGSCVAELGRQGRGGVRGRGSLGQDRRGRQGFPDGVLLSHATRRGFSGESGRACASSRAPTGYAFITDTVSRQRRTGLCGQVAVI